MGVTAFYIWTATSSREPFNWSLPKSDQYNLLTDGFLSGHLYLAKDPPPELLALKDPWDPKANRAYRLHDASLYGGHYYAYFGPVPVITLFLPWRVITGHGMPNHFATIVFLMCGYILSCLLLFTLLAGAGIRLSWFQKRLAIVALGLCHTGPIILRRASMYETAVAAAYAFMLAGLYFLARYVISARSRPWNAWMAGWCFGLTAGCRPNYALVAVIIAGAYWLYVRRVKSDRAGLYRLAVPIVFCGLMLAWYNYARFGNPLNVGQSYQLVGSAADRGITSKISHVLPGLYRLLVQSPVWMRRFPFAELATPGDFGAEQFRPQYDHIEPIAGLFIISPICLMGICLPLFLFCVGNRITPSVRFVLLTMYAAALANLVAIVLTVNQAAQRYEVDFAPSLLVLSLFAIIYVAPNSRFMTGIMTGAVVFSALVPAALSINGYDHSLMEDNPSTFDKIAAIFGEDSRTTRHALRDFTFTGEIAFRSQPAGKREALLTIGVRRRSDAVFIEYLGENQLRLGCSSSGHPTYYGPDLAVTPGRTYRLRMDTRPVPEHLTVWVDDAVIVLSALISLHPTSIADATVLTNNIGMPPNVQPFSGEFHSAKGLEIISSPR